MGQHHNNFMVNNNRQLANWSDILNSKQANVVFCFGITPEGQIEICTNTRSYTDMKAMLERAITVVNEQIEKENNKIILLQP